MLWCNKIHFKTILILSKIARKLTKRLEMQKTKIEEICNQKYIPKPSKSQNTLAQSLERKFHSKKTENKANHLAVLIRLQ